MDSKLSQRLDPQVRKVWRISAALWTVPLGVVVLAGAFMWVCLLPESDGAVLAFAVCVVFVLAMLAIFIGVVPTLRYRRWSYEVSGEFLEIAKGGIFVHRRYTIPFIRVQNTDVRQGPVMRAFGLATVSVSTAADSHDIPGLRTDAADLLRARTAELARIAREDV